MKMIDISRASKSDKEDALKESHVPSRAARSGADGGCAGRPACRRAAAGRRAAVSLSNATCDCYTYIVIVALALVVTDVEMHTFYFFYFAHMCFVKNNYFF